MSPAGSSWEPEDVKVLELENEVVHQRDQSREHRVAEKDERIHFFGESTARRIGF